MALPTPVFGPNALLLKENIRYIVPQAHEVDTKSFEFSLAQKKPNSSTPQVISFTGFSLAEGDTIVLKRNKPGKVTVFIRKASTGEVKFVDVSNDEPGDEYYLWTTETFNFSDQIQLNGLILPRFWGKISSSKPRGFKRDKDTEHNGINTLFNRVDRNKFFAAGDDFTQETDILKPEFAILADLQNPVTASRFTVEKSLNAFYLGGTSSQYIASDGYHVFATFHVSSMSNGNDSLSSNYTLFTDTNNSFGVYFRTSSQSGFSPEDQFVEVVLTHTTPSNVVTTFLTASMNEIHKLEASYDANDAQLNLKIDETTSSIAPVSSLVNLGDMRIGTLNVPIGSGSTTISTSDVTSSVDLIDLAFAATKSNSNVTSAVVNHLDRIYNFGIPIAYKIPTLLSGATFWGRTAPGDISVTGGGTEVFEFSNKLGDTEIITLTPEYDELPVLVTVDAEKPLSGTNFSGSLNVPSLAITSPPLSYVSESQYQIFGVFRTNKVLTNVTSSDLIQLNEQLIGDDLQHLSLLLRQGTGSNDAVIMALHDEAGGAGDRHVLSSSITLGEMYVVDFSYKQNSLEGMRLQINNNTPITNSKAAKVDLTTARPSPDLFYIGRGQNFVSSSKVDTDLLEIYLGKRVISGSQRSLLKKYFFDRYSITSST